MICMTRRRTLLSLLLSTPLLLGACTLPGGAAYPTTATTTSSATGSTAASTQLTLSTEPSDALGIIYSTLSAATRSIAIDLYELDDARVVAILQSKAAAGLSVRVVLDAAYSGARVNAAAVAQLAASRVKVHWAPKTAIYHAKFIVTDGQTLLLGTGNLTSRYYATTRDFFITDTSAPDVAAASSAFAEDFAGQALTSPNTGDLLFSPRSQDAILGLINSAHTTLAIENEEMASKPIISALTAAAHRGVSVHVTMTYSASWVTAFNTLRAAGVAVHLYHGEHPIYVHAKAICVDCLSLTPRAFVGSQNFSTSSLVYNRELGITTTAPSITAPLNMVLTSDFNAASAY